MWSCWIILKGDNFMENNNLEPESTKNQEAKPFKVFQNQTEFESFMAYSEENLKSKIENDIKEKPLIDADDPAYKSYLNYMTKKQEMINKQKRTTCKYITFGIIALLIIFAILYYIIFCIEGSDDMDIDEF